MRIFPTEILEFTTEHYVSSVRTRSQIIYIVVILSFLACVTSLPFVKVDVSVQSRGTLRTATSQTPITSSASGLISHKFYKENNLVETGDTLFIITSNKVQRQIHLLADLIARKKSELNDLNKLESLDRAALMAAEINFQNSFETNHYASDFEQFYVQLAEYLRAEIFQKKRFERFLSLHEKGMTTDDSFEQTRLNYVKVGDELTVFIESSRRRWRQLGADESLELARLEAEMDRLRIEEDLYTIKSPFTGTIQGIENLSVGSFVAAGQQLGIVSPNDELLVEALIDPADIGFVNKGSQLRIQVDAFNFREWGSINGTVKDISEDIAIAGNKPFFRVKCSIDRTHLELNNGARGKLRKGMSVTCRFLITERTLFQLIFDKVDNWFSPYEVEKDPA